MTDGLLILTGTIIAAVIGIVPATLVWRDARAARNEARAMRADIATNHGLRPGEYLELISANVNDLHDTVAALHVAVADHADRITRLEGQRRAL